MRSVCFLLVLASAGVTFGQAVPRYQPPAGSTVSPYLGLLRTDGGALPSYYAFVRPLEAQQRLQRATSLLGEETRRIDRVLEEGLVQSRALPTGTAAGFLTVQRKSGSPFGNRGEYYRTFDARRRRR